LKRYRTTGDPLTLEQRIHLGQVWLGVLAGREVRVLCAERGLLLSIDLETALRKLQAPRVPGGSPALRLAALPGGRELQVLPNGAGVLFAVEEREAVFRLLEGTEVWERRRTVDPRTVRVRGSLRAEGDGPVVREIDDR